MHPGDNSWNCCREPLPAGTRTLCSASAWSGWTRQCPCRALALDSACPRPRPPPRRQCRAPAVEKGVDVVVAAGSFRHQLPFQPIIIHHTSYIIHHPSTSCPLNGDRDLLPDGPLQLHLRGRAGVEEESPISEPRLNRTEREGGGEKSSSGSSISSALAGSVGAAEERRPEREEAHGGRPLGPPLPAQPSSTTARVRKPRRGHGAAWPAPNRSGASRLESERR